MTERFVMLESDYILQLSPIKTEEKLCATETRRARIELI